MYTGLIRLITMPGGTTLKPHKLVCDADLAKFKANFETWTDTKITLQYLRFAPNFYNLCDFRRKRLPN